MRSNRGFQPDRRLQDGCCTNNQRSGNIKGHLQSAPPIDPGEIGPSANALTATERLAYEAGRDQAHADRWRIDAEISERRGEPSETARQYQAQYQAEADDAWRRLAEAKGLTP
jgi:hypothetical protein